MSGASEDERPLRFSRRAKRSITSKKVVKEDRISSLPDRLLIHILSFLSDTKQVARTCVLSKRWEYVWTNLLEVGLRQFSKNIAEVSKFVDVVGRLLAMRKNLNKLTLGFSYDKRIDSNLNLLIYHAVKNKVKDINFTACGSKSYELPELFYSNSSLTNLTLRGCVLAPRGIVSWGSLKTLSIGPRSTNSSMEKVLLGCPVLEVLRLNNREGLDSLNISSTNLTTLEIHETSFPIKDVVLDISAPYLRVLSICNYNSSLKFRLRNVQSVVQARLDIDCRCCEMGKRKNYMKELLEKLPSIEKLDLGPHCIKTVNCMMTEEIPLFTKLRCLTLKDNCDYAALAMLRRSPNLETLHIRRDWTSPMQQGSNIVHIGPREYQRPSIYGQPGSSSYTVYDSDSDYNSDCEGVSSTPPETNQGKQKRSRGPTRMPRSWNNGIVNIGFDERNQPIGDNAAKLAHQIGRVVRDMNLFPPSTDDWRHIDHSIKETKWLEFKANYTLVEGYKSTFFKKLGRTWREWKSELKEHYSQYETDEERIAHCPLRLNLDEWKLLVDKWSNDPNVKMISERNRANSKQLRTYHRTGKKSYPRLRAEMFIENGVEPSKYDVWLKGNTPKNGHHDEYTSSLIEKVTDIISENPEAMNSNELKDQAFDIVFGKEKYSRARTYGFGVTPNQVSAAKDRESIIDKKVSLMLNSFRESVREEMMLEIQEEIEKRIENALQSRFQQNVQLPKEPPTNINQGYAVPQASIVRQKNVKLYYQ